jgi:hypothetical protein
MLKHLIYLLLGITFLSAMVGLFLFVVTFWKFCLVVGILMGAYGVGRSLFSV